MKIHTIQLNIEDFEAGTAGMDATERGAYISLLICLYKVSTNTLPNDDKRLARMACLTTRQWVKIRPILEPKFIVGEHVWEHKRVSQEAVRYAKLSNKNQSNALKGHNTSLPVGVPNASQTGANISNKEEVIKKEDKEKEIPNGIPKKGALEKEAVEIYNLCAEQNDLPKVQKLTDTRKSKLNARLKDCGGIEGWKLAVEKLADSPFCRGESATGWKADFDFLIQEKSFTKLMEGSYDNNENNTNSNGKGNNQNAKSKGNADEELREFLERTGNGAPSEGFDFCLQGSDDVQRTP